MTDPRVAAVEDNLLSFIEAMARMPQFRVEPADDVVALHSDVAFPMFNPVADARFAPETACERGGQVVASYVARGLPFMWWLTPSTTSPELEAVLGGAGMAREDIPGMHVALDGPCTPALAAGTELTEVTQREPFVSTLIEAFGMPTELVGDFDGLLAGFADQPLVNVLATVAGRPAATGSAWIDGTTVGLYNIATLTELRGRGLGYAVTARLMDLARERGCTDAVLHASEQGRPVYERLGFTHVCDVPQFIWVPSD